MLEGKKNLELSVEHGTKSKRRLKMPKHYGKHKPASQKSRLDWYLYHKEKGTLKKGKKKKKAKKEWYYG